MGNILFGMDYEEFIMINEEAHAFLGDGECIEIVNISHDSNDESGFMIYYDNYINMQSECCGLSDLMNAVISHEIYITNPSSLMECTY